MERIKKAIAPKKGKLLNFNREHNEKKEKRLITLLIDMIVRATLKEYYEKGN